MRHSRSDQFTDALGRRDLWAGRRWHDVTDDPNDAAALVLRARVIRSAWLPPVADRVQFLLDACRDKRVLDIGCVAHDPARMAAPNWLHRRIADVASECVGVDVLEDGVRAMTELGFDAIVHDLGTGLGPVLARSPFDVIVAGELIEHVDDIGMLFRTAKHALADDGQLIITTPNPWAPRRVRAAQRGDVQDNVDHILFAFPSGIAELAERHGLRLRSATTTSSVPRTSLRDAARSVRARVRGRHWQSTGVTTVGTERAVRIEQSALVRGLRRLMLRTRRFVGETFIYVVGRPTDLDSNRG